MIGEWLATLDWGDVPGWIGVGLTIALSVSALLGRNRIAGYVRRKAKEPVPTGPPPRWFLRPNGPDGMEYLLINWAWVKTYNVTIHPLDSRSTVLSNGYWKTFSEHALARVDLRIDPSLEAQGSKAEFRLEWQRADGSSYFQHIDAQPKRLNGTAAHLPIALGRVLPLTSAQSEDEV